jgi:hypothetical protein
MCSLHRCQFVVCTLYTVYHLRGCKLRNTQDSSKGLAAVLWMAEIQGRNMWERLTVNINIVQEVGNKICVCNTVLRKMCNGKFEMCVYLFKRFFFSR